ncbi:unannotated protein [freshwater metagenome]|uniref:Unannotated protein n=1 Tax=freshwater metagenome TaxID=449393 RepID=A0A6J6NSD7_9ZZZZ
MCIEQILNLFGGDVLTLTNDDVFDAAREHHVTVWAKMSNVSRAEIAILVKCLLGEFGVGIALGNHWTLDSDLAIDSCRSQAAIL